MNSEGNDQNHNMIEICMYRNSHQLSQWLTSASEKPAFLQHYVYHDLYPAWLVFLWHGFLFLVCLTSLTAVSWTHRKTYEKTTSYAGYTCMTYNWFLPLCKTKLIIYNNSHFIIQCSTLKKKRFVIPCGWPPPHPPHQGWKS